MAIERYALNDAALVYQKDSSIGLGLGFRPRDLKAPTDTFSGGWRMRSPAWVTRAMPAES